MYLSELIPAVIPTIDFIYRVKVKHGVVEV